MILDEELLLINKKNAGPVMDGLTLWIDGRDSVASDKSLTDRISGHQIVPSYIYSQNNWMIVNDGLNIKMQSSANDSVWYADEERVFSDAGTIEIVLGLSSNAIIAGLLTTNPLYGRVTCNNQTVRVNTSAGNSGTQVVSSGTPIQHIVAKNRKVYANGVAYDAPWGYTDLSFSKYLLLVRCYGSAITAYLGSLRVYNRELTEEEILQNLEYEKAIGRVVL